MKDLNLREALQLFDQISRSSLTCTKYSFAAIITAYVLADAIKCLKSEKSK